MRNYLRLTFLTLIAVGISIAPEASAIEWKRWFGFGQENAKVRQVDLVVREQPADRAVGIKPLDMEMRPSTIELLNPAAIARLGGGFDKVEIFDNSPTGFVGAHSRIGVILPDDWSEEIRGKALESFTKQGMEVKAINDKVEGSHDMIILPGGVYNWMDQTISNGHFVGLAGELAATSGMPLQKPVDINVTGTLKIANYSSVENVTLNNNGQIVVGDHVTFTNVKVLNAPGSKFVTNGAPNSISFSDSEISCSEFNPDSSTMASTGISQLGGSTNQTNNSIHDCDVGILVLGQGAVMKAVQNTFNNTKVGIMFQCPSGDTACQGTPPSGLVSRNEFSNTKIGVVVNAGVPDITALNKFDPGSVKIGLLNVSPHTFASTSGGKPLNALLNNWPIPMSASLLEGADSKLAANAGSFSSSTFLAIASDPRMPKNLVEVYGNSATPSNRPRTQIAVSCNLIQEN